MEKVQKCALNRVFESIYRKSRHVSRGFIRLHLKNISFKWKKSICWNCHIQS